MSRIFYDLKRIKGIVFDIDGVLSPLTIPVDHEGRPMRMTNLRDGYAINQASHRGLKLAVISGARVSGIEHRLADLGITDVFMGVPDKAAQLAEWMLSRGLKPFEVAYIGDDIPDIEPMKMSGLKVAPRDAAAEVKSVANYISPFDGGYGVARDLIEQVMKAQSIWPSTGGQTI